MITNNGKEIISKYLLGQVPAYATHMSIGCGAKPLDTLDPLPNSIYSKERMDFEMARVPISSKGFVDDSDTFSLLYKEISSNYAQLTTTVAHNISAGETIIVNGVDTTFDGQYVVYDIPSTTTFRYYLIAEDVAEDTPATGSVIVSRTKISFTAELPTENRYDITEIGIWSAANNSLTGQYDSRTIFNFTDLWQLHEISISDPPLLTLGSPTITDIPDNADTSTAFYASTSDPIFQVNTRKIRGEGPRNLNRTLLIRGDLSEITGDIDGEWQATGKHVHLNDINFDISKNNVSDIMKLAFSVIDRSAAAHTNIDNVKIFMEFYRNESTENGFAKIQIYVPGTNYLDDNNYYVASTTVSQNIDPDNPTASSSLPYIKFYTANDFVSSAIRVCRIFVEITTSGSPSTDHYISFDGFRIDNTTENPLYKMSGYSIVKNNGVPINKSENTNNYIDFRFGIQV